MIKSCKMFVGFVVVLNAKRIWYVRETMVLFRPKGKEKISEKAKKTIHSDSDSTFHRKIFTLRNQIAL